MSTVTSSNGETYTTGSLATLDAVDLALHRTLATSKLHEQHIGPVLLGIQSSHATRSITVDAVAYDVVDGRRTRLLLDKDDGLLEVALNLDSVLGGLEVLLASFGGEELDDGEV
jgi:hypothetical protein